MKKFTILSLMVFAAFASFAQFNKGRMLVGGSSEFRTETEKSKSGGTTVTDGRWTNLSFAPRFGYFVIDNLAVGAGLSIGLGKWADENDNDDDYTSSNIQFQPFARYYLPQGIFFQGQVGLGSGKTNYNDRPDYKYNLSSLAISAGYAFFLNDNVAVEPSLGYRTTGWKNKDSEVKDIDSGLFLQIGFQIYLGNK